MFKFTTLWAHQISLINLCIYILQCARYMQVSHTTNKPSTLPIYVIEFYELRRKEFNVFSFSEDWSERFFLTMKLWEWPIKTVPNLLSIMMLLCVGNLWIQID